MDEGETPDAAAALAALFASREGALPTSRLGRLWKTGRSAAGAAAAMAGGALAGRGAGLAALDAAAMQRLVQGLGELKGVAMKMGQMMSYVDASLPDETRALFALLRTTSQPAPFASVEATVTAALGARAPALLATMERRPVATASIGQVHRATLGGDDVAVKVRHPGIVRAIDADLRSVAVAPAVAAVFAPGAAGTVASFVDEARAALLDECDFTREAEHQAAFARLFAEDADIIVPAVERAWCTPEVLVSHWVAGRSWEQLLASQPSQAARDRVGAALYRFFVGSLYGHGLLHADPHPGNLAFTDDGRVVVYDYGCVRAFDDATITGLLALRAAVIADDEAAVGAALATLGTRKPVPAASAPTLMRFLRGFFAPSLATGRRRVAADAAWEAREVMRDKKAMMQIALPGKLLFLLRIRFGLYALLAELGAEADWSAVEDEALRAR